MSITLRVKKIEDGRWFVKAIESVSGWMVGVWNGVSEQDALFNATDALNKMEIYDNFLIEHLK